MNAEKPKIIANPKYTLDGHGGRAAEHRAEMETIARQIYEEESQKTLEIIKEMIDQESARAYKQAIDDFLGALNYDIESVTRIGIDGCRDIFEDRKAQKYISDHIMKEISEKLMNRRFK